MTSFYFKIISIFTLISMTGTISAAQGFGMTAAITTITEMRSTLEETRANNDRAWIDGILEAEIDPNITGEDGNTPLIVAVRYSFDEGYSSDDWFEVVIALLEAGADPRFQGESSDTTPFGEALNRNDTHRVTVALLQAQREIEARRTSSRLCDQDDAYLLQKTVEGETTRDTGPIIKENPITSTLCDEWVRLTYGNNTTHYNEYTHSSYLKWINSL